MERSNGETSKSHSQYLPTLKQLPLVYDAMKARYRARGFKAGYQPRTMQANRIFELSKPISPIHLVNVAPQEEIRWLSDYFVGPVLLAWIWVDEGERLTRVLSDEDHTISGSGELPFDIEVLNWDSDRALSQKFSNVVVERYYVANLRDVLTEDLAESIRRVELFFDAVLTDLKEDVSRGFRPKRRSR